MGQSYSFGAQHRIKKKSDFAFVQAHARKLYSRHFLILINEGRTHKSRLGVTITTKVSPLAVRRNKLKRRLKEVFRLQQERFIQPFDMIIIARKNATDCDYETVKREVMGALFHGGILKD